MSEDIKGYLCKQLASGKLEDWQYEQLVDALRVLFVQVVQAPWAQTFPCEAWKAPQLNFAADIDYYSRYYYTPLVSLPYPNRSD